jgi:acyl-CoA thioester hydrolase
MSDTSADNILGALSALISPSKPKPHERRDYAHFRTLPTRWMDNDTYGHINNVVYYSFFDTVVNATLIEAGELDMEKGAVIGLVVETHCNYFAPLTFPQTVHAGLRVAHIGASSVRYEIGLFAEHENSSAAQGHFVHVYVDRINRRPVSLPLSLTNCLEKLKV